LNGHGVLKPTDKRLLNFTLPKHPRLSLNKHFSPSETPQSESSKIPLTIEKAKKSGTREYVMRRFPYIVIYRVTDTKVSIVRVLHQAMRYFN